MKKLLLLSFTVIASLSVSLAQPTIYTADNNPGAIGGVNVFLGPTALVGAIAAAVDDDIIHVVRSSLNYGTITIDKRLNIFGIGLNPDTDGNERSIVGTVTIADPAASGTRISGLHIPTILNLGGVAGVLSNILIENCNILRIQHISTITTDITNLIIRNNVLGSGFGAGSDETIDLIANFHSNVIIANNVIYGTSNNDNGFINANNSTSVENNIFSGSDSNDNAFETFNGNTVKNNIFLRVAPRARLAVVNNTFEYNLSFSCATRCSFLSTGGNTEAFNLVGVDPLLANAPLNNAIDFATFDPTLDPGAPSLAIGAGEGGTDMGVFGGPAPMKLSGTLIPLIQSLTLPSMVLKGTDLPVQIKAEGN